MTKTVRGNCPECGKNKYATVLAEHFYRDDDDGESEAYMSYRMAILKCSGCQTMYALSEEWFSEDWNYRFDPTTGQHEPYIPSKIVYWPEAPKRALPDWAIDLEALDTDLSRIFDEVHAALNAELFILTAIGVRTAFDRASEILGIDANERFENKLRDLAQKNHISLHEKTALEVLVEAGSAAAHRGWRPNANQIDQLMLILESFLHRCFITSDAAAKLAASVPKRQKSAEKPKKSD